MKVRANCFAPKHSTVSSSVSIFSSFRNATQEVSIWIWINNNINYRFLTLENIEKILRLWFWFSSHKQPAFDREGVRWGTPALERWIMAPIRWRRDQTPEIVRCPSRARSRRRRALEGLRLPSYWPHRSETDLTFQMGAAFV